MPPCGWTYSRAVHFVMSGARKLAVQLVDCRAAVVGLRDAAVACHRVGGLNAERCTY